MAITKLSPKDAKAKVDAETAAVIDVRMAYDWAGGRIPGSINLPNQAIKFRKAEVPEGKELIFVGTNTEKAQVTAEVATSMGFETVYIIDGGFDAWEGAGLPTETISGS